MLTYKHENVIYINDIHRKANYKKNYAVRERYIDVGNDPIFWSAPENAFQIHKTTVSRLAGVL